MGKIGNNQKGFSAAEALLIIFVVAVIGFGGYFIWHNHAPKTPKQSTTSTENSVTTKPAVADTAKPMTLTLLSGVKSTASPLTYSRDTASVIDNIVSFAQPDDWRDDADITASGCGIANCLGQTMIVPGDENEDGANYPDYFVVTISAFQTSDDAKAIFANNWQDSGAAPASAFSTFTTMAGTQGFKYDFEPVTPTKQNSNAYVEHVAYGISNGSYAAILNVSYFNQSNKSFANISVTDYGQYAATVEQIAKTLHLSN